MLSDNDGSIYNAISQNDEISLSVNGTVQFVGIVVNKSKKDNKKLEIKGRDYFALLIAKYAQFKQYTNQTASQILTDLIDTYFSGTLSTSGIQATANQYTRKYTLYNIGHIITELDGLEGFVTYVDNNKVVHFEPINYNDSGVHLTETDILAMKHEHQSDKIINRVIVVYGTNLDAAVEREDGSSIAIYGEKEIVEVKKGITSEADAISYADGILNRSANPQEPIEVTISQNLSLSAGSLIWLKYADIGYSTETQFIIREAVHSLAPPYTRLKLNVFRKETVQALNEMIRKIRGIDEDRISSTVSITKTTDSLTEVTASLSCTTKRRTISGALVGEFTAGKKRAGQLSGNYTTLETITPVLVNKGIESMLRIWFQLATVPSLYDSANSHIAFGTGSTIAKSEDTQLSNEIGRMQTEPGTPNIPGTGQVRWKITVGDAELVNGSITEMGIFNAASAGEMLMRGILAATTKSQNEEIEIEVTLTLTGLQSAALDLLAKLMSGMDVNYIDLGNASIEVSDGVTPYREAAASLQFTNANYNEIIADITVTNPGEVATGYHMTSSKLYNKTSGGTQVTGNTIDVTTETGKDNRIRQRIKVKRS